jgi:hypothetical protein
MEIREHERCVVTESSYYACLIHRGFIAGGYDGG